MNLASLEQTLRSEGAQSAIEQLCHQLREEKDYANLFYALLLKKRHELGVSPVPTESAQALPASAHSAYEEAIREAGHTVGQLYLEAGDIPRAWVYFRMLGEAEPIAKALENHQIPEGEDDQALIEIAFHHGVLPRKGFDWLLSRHGICSAITLVSSHEFAQMDVRQYCIQKLVQAMHEQLLYRLTEEVTQHEGKAPGTSSIRELIAGRDWLFGEDCYHVDVSHLSSVAQLSLQLTPCPELELARDLCAYGVRVPERFQFRSDPPFDDPYRDMGIYLATVAGDDREAGVAHFKAKVEALDLENDSLFPAEVLVNLLVRLERFEEAIDISRRFLSQPGRVPSTCPNLVELCRMAGRYEALVDVAREQGDAVHFLAGMLAEKR